MASNKETIIPGDVVIIYQNAIPVDFYHIIDIQVEGIKRDFWDVTFMKIGMPTMIWSWKLDSDQLKGGDFTMNGVPCRLQLYSRPQKIVKQNSIKETISAPTEEDSLL